MGKESETKQRILAAAAALLEENLDTDAITVRELARKAGVGVGLINYHFRSREELLSQAIGALMAGIARDPAQWREEGEDNPARRLAALLKNLYQYAAPYEKLIRFVLLQGIQRGETDAFLYLVPLLREALPGQDEFALRIAATQILLPLQAASINPEAFLSFSGIDLRDAPQRNRYIDSLVDNLLAGAPAKPSPSSF